MRRGKPVLGSRGRRIGGGAEMSTKNQWIFRKEHQFGRHEALSRHYRFRTNFFQARCPIHVESSLSQAGMTSWPWHRGPSISPKDLKSRVRVPEGSKLCAMEIHPKIW